MSTSETSSTASSLKVTGPVYNSKLNHRHQKGGAAATPASTWSSTSSSSSASSADEGSVGTELALKIFKEHVLPATTTLSFDTERRVKKMTPPDLKAWFVNEVLKKSSESSASSSSSSSMTSSSDPLINQAEVIAKLAEAEIKIKDLEQSIELQTSAYNKDLAAADEAIKTNQQCLAESQQKFELSNTTIKELGEQLGKEKERVATDKEQQQQKVKELEEALNQQKLLAEQQALVASDLLQANEKNLKEIQEKLALADTNVQKLMKSLGEETESAKTFKERLGVSSGRLHQLAEAAEKLVNTLLSGTYNTEVEAAKAKVSTLLRGEGAKTVAQVNPINSPLDKATLLIKQVSDFQAKSSALIADIEAKKGPKPEDITEFSISLLTLIGNAQSIQKNVETTVEDLKESILYGNRDTVPLEHVETTARALSLSAHAISTRLREAENAHSILKKNTEELSTRWLSMVQTLNEAARKLGEKCEKAGFAAEEMPGYQENIGQVGNILEQVSDSIVTLVTTCNPILEIRQDLISLAVDCESSAMTLAGVTWRSIRKSLEQMYSVSFNDKVLFDTYTAKLNDTYVQQKNALRALTNRGERMLPLITALIKELDDKVAAGTANENIPASALSCFAFVENQPLDVVKNMFDEFRIANKGRFTLSTLLKQKLEDYKTACSAAKQEAGRTYDATQRMGVYITETRYVAGVWPWTPYVDPELRTPFEAKATPALSLSASSSSSSDGEGIAS